MAGSIGFLAKLTDAFVVLDGCLGQVGPWLHCGVGVTTASVYEVKRVDSDYFAEL